MEQFKARNLSMLMDLYSMTMSNGYYLDNTADNLVAFDVFYRRNPDSGGFAIFAGLEQVLDFLEDFHFTQDDIDYFKSLNLYNNEFLDSLINYRFRGTIMAMPEGSVMYPKEPILTVIAPLMDAQLIETAILAQINHQSLIATKTQRIVQSALGRPVSDFGARRAHNIDAAVYGARAAYIGGVNSTSTVMAAKMFNIPVNGTMAHSWIMCHKDEYTAFKHFVEIYPQNSILLIDTYDVMTSGLPNAIKVAKEVLEPQGKRLKGVRIDSGDLAYLSKEARKVLDAAGLTDCKIVASNSLDEFTIRSILDQGGCIDSFGVGERLITARSEPVFGAVYKLAAIKENGKFIPKIKVSDTVEKITNPGRKHLWRIYDKRGYAVADLITLEDEIPDLTKEYTFIDPNKPWKSKSFVGCTMRQMLETVMIDGKRIKPSPSLDQIRAYVKNQLEHEIWPEEQRFENPRHHFLDMSPAYYKMKIELLEEAHKHEQ